MGHVNAHVSTHCVCSAMIGEHIKQRHLLNEGHKGRRYNNNDRKEHTISGHAIRNTGTGSTTPVCVVRSHSLL